MLNALFKCTILYYVVTKLRMYTVCMLRQGILHTRGGKETDFGPCFARDEK